MEDLFKLYGGRYLVTVDESYFGQKVFATHAGHAAKVLWDEVRVRLPEYYELVGNYGTIYPFGDRDYAVRVSSKFVHSLKKRHPDWNLIQDANEESTLTFPESELKQVKSIIKPKRRTTASVKQVERAKSYVEKKKKGKKDECKESS